MRNLQVFSSRTWIVIGAVGIILLVALAFVREYVRTIDISTELERMEAENAALNAQHLASLELISQFSTETAVEKDARTKLNLAKSGETMYVVEDDISENTLNTTLAEEQGIVLDPGLSNPTKWFYYFFSSDKEAGAL